VNRHCALHAPRAELTLATALSSIVATVVPPHPHARLYPSAPRPPSPTLAVTLAFTLALTLARTLAPTLARTLALSLAFTLRAPGGSLPTLLRLR